MNKFLALLFLLFSFVPCEAQWTQKNDIPFVAHHTNGFGINGKGYVIQGQPQINAGVSQNRFWEYDPQTDDWTSLGFVPTQDRTFSIGDEMNGKYYFGFGVDRNDLWEYDPATNEFTELPACPCTPRAHPAFVAHQEKIYIGSGSTGNGDLRDWWVFDFATMTWSQKDNIPGNNRHHPFQFGIDDAIYVGGGHIGNWLRYDINTENWSAINDFPGGRVAGTQFSYEGKGFVLSGDAADHSVLPDNQFLVYYPDLDEWFVLPFDDSMHRWAGASFIIDDMLYFFGGLGFVGGDDNDMWTFDMSSISCLGPLEFSAVSITENSAGVIWTNSPEGDAESLEWRAVGDANWNTITEPQPIQTITGLEGCTEYEFRLSTACDSGTSYTEPFQFSTKGCGNCTDEDYCDVAAEHNATNSYIDEVRIEGFENQSGNNGGYEQFITSNSVEVQLGGSFELEIKPGYSTAITSGNCKAWVDFDGDGVFSNEELVVEQTGITDTYTKNVSIPLDAAPGISRLRIVFDIYPITYGACDGNNLLEGEVEDYCLTVLDEISGTDDLGQGDLISVYPNPTDGLLWIEQQDFNIQELAIFDVNGSQLKQIADPTAVININDLASGVYILKIKTDKFTHHRKLTKR